MRLAITIQIVLLCIIFTIISIFTVDAVTVRKAELTSVMAIDVTNTVKSFFEGDIAGEALEDELTSAVENAVASEYMDISVTVFYDTAFNKCIKTHPYGTCFTVRTIYSHAENFLREGKFLLLSYISEYR